MADQFVTQVPPGQGKLPPAGPQPCEHLECGRATQNRCCQKVLCAEHMLVHWTKEHK